MNAEPVYSWLMNCAAAGEIVASPLSRSHLLTLPLGKPHDTHDLYERFTEWARCHSKHICNYNGFGKVMTNALGEERHRHNLVIDGKNLAGYAVPDADALTKAVDNALGISLEGTI